jgi:hypothetical protein
VLRTVHRVNGRTRKRRAERDEIRAAGLRKEILLCVGSSVSIIIVAVGNHLDGEPDDSPFRRPRAENQ